MGGCDQAGRLRWLAALLIVVVPLLWPLQG